MGIEKRVKNLEDRANIVIPERRTLDLSKLSDTERIELDALCAKVVWIDGTPDFKALDLDQLDRLHTLRSKVESDDEHQEAA